MFKVMTAGLVLSKDHKSLGDARLSKIDAIADSHASIARYRRQIIDLKDDIAGANEFIAGLTIKKQEIDDV